MRNTEQVLHTLGDQRGSQTEAGAHCEDQRHQVEVINDGTEQPFRMFLTDERYQRGAGTDDIHLTYKEEVGEGYRKEAIGCPRQRPPVEQAVRQTYLFRARGIWFQAERRGGDIVVDLNRAPEQHRSGCTGREHHKNPAGGAKLRFFVT